MNFKVKDNVIVKIEIQKSGLKKILSKDPQPDSKVVEKIFPIISVHQDVETYSIIIDDDIPGWNISKFHIKYHDVDEKFYGKKFYDITEALIIRKK